MREGGEGGIEGGRKGKREGQAIESSESTTRGTYPHYNTEQS